MAEIRPELLEELLKDYEKPEDLTGPDGLLRALFKRLIETAAGVELTELARHLGARLVTADRKLAGAPGIGVPVIAP